MRTQFGICYFTDDIFQSQVKILSIQNNLYAKYFIIQSFN
jgi:hypothetical protein